MVMRLEKGKGKRTVGGEERGEREKGREEDEKGVARGVGLGRGWKGR